MKTIARISIAVTAALASVFVAAPAFAHDGEAHDPATVFSTAGDPLQVGAILIVGIVLLALVLILSQWIGSAFEKKTRS